MEEFQIINAALLISYSLGVFCTSAYLKQKAIPKSSPPGSIRGISGAILIICISMAFIHLIGKGVFNSNSDNKLLESYIKSALRIGVIVLPLLLILLVLFFEKFINYLLGKRGSSRNEKISANTLQLNNSYKILASKSDPTSTNTNPLIIPYEIL